MRNTKPIILLILGMILSSHCYAASPVSQESIERQQKMLQAKKRLANMPLPLPDANDPIDSKSGSNNPKSNTSTKKAASIRDHAFKQLLDKAIPLTPEQIIELHKKLNESQRATSTSPTVPPKPVSTTLSIDLSTGTTPPVVRLAAGFVTSLVFVDATGAPWPVVDYNLGNPKDFNMQWDKKTNTLFVQSLKKYSSGNLAIRLQDLNTPVMLSMVSGQRKVDYRVDLRVQARGPNALPAVAENNDNNVSQELIDVLDGIAPPNSTELAINNNLGRAWMHGEKLILRTKLTILSPAWSSVVSGPDGTKVYEMAPTPLVLAMQSGKPTKIYIKGL